MKPIRTLHTNVVFALVGGTAENDLPLCRRLEDGEITLSSTWEPTDHEREAIAAGANIELTVWGNRTPPVALRAVPTN